MGLGGLLAAGLTGGAAAPLVAAMMAGGGTLAGGMLGREAAKQGWFNTDKAKIKGGRFYKDEAQSLISDIGQSIWAGAGKAALTAGSGKLLGKVGGKLGIGSKGGINVSDVDTKNLKLGNIFKAGESAHTYSDTALGKLGKALDIKGSAIVKAGDVVGKVGGKALDYGKAVVGTAEYRAKEFGKKVGEKIGDTVHSVNEDIKLAKLANLQEPTKYRVTGDDLYSMFEAGMEDPSLVAGYDQTSDTMSMLNLDKIKGIKTSDLGLRDLGIEDIGISDIMSAEGLEEKTPLARLAGADRGLSKNERGLYDTMNMMADQGYQVGPGGQLPEEFGRGFIDKSGGIVRQPSRPDVQFTPQVEDSFSTANADIRDFDDYLDNIQATNQPLQFDNWASPPAYDPNFGNPNTLESLSSSP